MLFKRRGRRFYTNISAKRRKSGIKIEFISFIPDEKAHLANTAIPSLKITVGISVRESKKGTFTVYTDDKALQTFNVTDSDNGKTFTVTTSVNAKDNGEIVRIWAKSECDGRENTLEAGILFVGKIYSGGILTGDTISIEEIKSALSEVKENAKGTAEYSTNDELGRFVYAYPTVLSKVTKITDESGIFDYSNSVSKEIMTIDGYEYEVIYLTDAMIFENLKIKFE